MRCPADVIIGLSSVKTTLFVVSTYLYEIAGDLQHADRVAFQQVETFMKGDQFWFTLPAKRRCQK